MLLRLNGLALTCAPLIERFSVWKGLQGSTSQKTPCTLGYTMPFFPQVNKKPAKLFNGKIY